MLRDIQSIWKTDKANGSNLVLYIYEEKILITYLKIGYYNYPCKYEVINNKLIIDLCDKMIFELKDNKLYFVDENNKLIEMKYAGEYAYDPNTTFVRIV